MDFKLTQKVSGLPDDLEWNSMPGFSVLTGPNGIGKTKLLHQLARCSSQLNIIKATGLTRVLLISSNDWNPTNIDWESDVRYGYSIHLSDKHLYDLYQIRYDTRLKTPPDMLGANPFHKGVDELVSEVHPEIPHKNMHFHAQYIKGDMLSFKEFVKKLPRCGVDLRDKNKIYLAGIFLRHYIDMLEVEHGYREELSRPAPWIVLNNLLNEFKLPVYFETPETINLPKRLPDNHFEAVAFLESLTFKTQLIHKNSEQTISVSELSSGERTLLGLALRLFEATEFSGFPHLLLLDEPDAHLHPEMSYKLIHSLYNVLYQKYKIKIILTTHSPTTVAHAPEGSIYSFDANTIKLKSKQEAIKNLTDGYLGITESSVYVWVEDKDDVNFYTKLFQSAVAQKLLNNRVGLNFISSSKIKGTPGGGGNTQTRSNLDLALDCFDKIEMLGENVTGLIDRDNGAFELDLGYKLERYSIENYLIDPVALYICLAQQERLPADIPVSKDKSDLPSWSAWNNDDIQKIADYFVGVIADDQDLDRNGGSEIIEYCTGATLKVPEWYLSHKGKELLSVIRKKFRGDRVGNSQIIAVIQTFQIIPTDIINILGRIQSIN